MQISFGNGTDWRILVDECSSCSCPGNSSALQMQGLCGKSTENFTAMDVILNTDILLPECTTAIPLIKAISLIIPSKKLASVDSGDTVPFPKNGDC